MGSCVELQGKHNEYILITGEKRFIFAKHLLTVSARSFMNEMAALTWPPLRSELIAVFDHKVTAFDVFKQLEARNKIEYPKIFFRHSRHCATSRAGTRRYHPIHPMEGLGNKSGDASAMDFCSFLDVPRNLRQSQEAAPDLKIGGADLIIEAQSPCI